MKKPYLLVVLITISCLLSCNDVHEKEKSAKDNVINPPLSNTGSTQTFTIDLDSLTKDFMTWYNYTCKNVHLSNDFIGLDTNLQTIDKKTFLNKLATENVVAAKTRIENGQPVYQLFKLNSKDEKNITAIVKQMAATEMAHHKMEGSQIPDFHFTDLNGRVYDKSSTKGKIVVLKCWFIHCVACVKEFPELNKLVEENQSRSDIVFISLAIDKKEELQKFLNTKEFKYAVIPETESYMTGKLNISAYPTHFLIDRNGKILKVVNRFDELTPHLKKQLEINTL